MTEVMIETERLILRPHRLSDFEACCSMFADPDVVRFAGGVTMSPEDVWHRLLRYTGHWSLFGFGLFAITDKQTQRFIGETGFADFHRGLDERFGSAPEAAWSLISAVHGKGYAQEATRATHAWFDRTFDFARTVCIISPANVASLTLAGKLGYRPFGQAVYRNATVQTLERVKVG